jgi:hypothetical protein
MPCYKAKGPLNKSHLHFGIPSGARQAAAAPRMKCEEPEEYTYGFGIHCFLVPDP